MKQQATPEQLAQLFDYNPNTGELKWRAAPSTLVEAGSLVGYVNKDGYVQAQVKRKKLLAHRVAWAIHFGAWPEGVIDHINGIRTDNRIENLRAVTPRINTENRRSAATQSKSGLLGAHARPNGRWRAEIRADGVRRRLGDFAAAEDAHQAYVDAKRVLHAGCTI